MNEKCVSISVLVENKTTELRLSPNVHITCCTVTLPIMNINFVRHRRMLSHLCRIRVLWFPLKTVVSVTETENFFKMVSTHCQKWLSIFGQKAQNFV